MTTFLEAAEIVLKQAKEPLSLAEITERARQRGLIKTEGKTPEATMSAALYGAPADVPIRREFQAGNRRAARGSVRWSYVKPGR